MKRTMKRKLEMLTNEGWARVFLAAVMVIFVLSVIPVTSNIMALLLVLVISPALFTHAVARRIDSFDDNVHSKVDMSRNWHMSYALGTSLIAALLTANIAAKIADLQLRLVVLSPEVAPLLVAFTFGLVGYRIAWQSIPPKIKGGSR